MNQDVDGLLANIQINPEDNSSGHGTTYENDLKPGKFNQIFAAVAATMSAFSSGMVLGWTSPILGDLSKGNYQGIKMDDAQLGWVGSLATFGAMLICIPAGLLIDIIGRKKMLLLIIVPFIAGWTIILFADSVLALYFGRFITGMAVGASCIAGPVYTVEIAHISMRGTLGSFFQLMIVSGVLFAYICGELLNVYQFTILCAATPLIFVILFAFQPESPIFLIKRGLTDQARSALKKLRGPNYDSQPELDQMTNDVKEDIETSVSVVELFHQKAIRRAIFISFALMFFQQFSGINAVLFYTSNIFKEAGTTINPNVATVVVGTCQVLATLVASLVIDKVGRRVLLITSSLAISLTALVLASYFTLKYRYDLNSFVNDFSFMPVVTISLFVVAFSLGLGPIPWLISGEILPVKIKSVIASTSATFNWGLAFLITKFYLDTSSAIGIDGAFYSLAVVSFVGFVFVLFLVPETKGKSIDEVLAVLQGI